MKKFSLEGRLGKKESAIALTCVLLVLVIGFTVAVLAHQKYLNTRRADLIASGTPGEGKLYMANVGSPVYVYSASQTEVDLADIITVSKGATYKIVRVTDAALNELETTSVLDVSGKQTYYVVVKVTSEGGIRSNSYILEITDTLAAKGALPEQGTSGGGISQIA